MEPKLGQLFLGGGSFKGKIYHSVGSSAQVRGRHKYAACADRADENFHSRGQHFMTRLLNYTPCGSQ